MRRRRKRTGAAATGPDRSAGSNRAARSSRDQARAQYAGAGRGSHYGERQNFDTDSDRDPGRGYVASDAQPNAGTNLDAGAD